MVLRRHRCPFNRTSTPLSSRSRTFLARAVSDLIFRYRRTLTLDSDMLVLGGPSYLTMIDEPFAAVRAQEADGRSLPYFSQGRMVITLEAGGEATFTEMAAALRDATANRDYGNVDGAVQNIFFRNRPRLLLDNRYKFSKCFVPPGTRDVEGFLAGRDVRILHFLGEKPWNVKARTMERAFRPVQDLWLRTFVKTALRDTTIAYVRSLMTQDAATTRHLRSMIEKKSQIDRELTDLLAEHLFDSWATPMTRALSGDGDE